MGLSSIFYRQMKRKEYKRKTSLPEADMTDHDKNANEALNEANDFFQDGIAFLEKGLHLQKNCGILRDAKSNMHH